MKIFKFIVYTVLVFSLITCEKEIDSPVETEFDNEFLPIKTGRWISYQIQEINLFTP